ncbi:MAG: redox-sensing transcriptional repressor Rex [SAR202 cluster bacterium]|jgi:redox-sensing transcriptional repressor|nr:redox-sensing transcriptional repressor Rex [SAR202 cluster bacterium]
MNEHEHEIPEIVIIRLPLYVRTLSELKLLNQITVSSQHLGNLLQTTPAQIRKDFSHFGKFGKQGRGYNIDYLLDELRQILNLNQKWNTCVVGIGNLGQAVINYHGFENEGYIIKAAFDISIPSNIANKDIVIKPISEMKSTIKKLNIKIGIVTVPAPDAQGVIDRLVESGIKAILNYAPMKPVLPKAIVCRNIDPILSLQSMSYYLNK